MTQPEPSKIQVDPTAVIDNQGDISSNVIRGLVHDLAVTRAALAASQDEVARLTRINESLQSRDGE